MSLPSPGTGLIGLNWVGTVIFTITAILAVVDPDTFELSAVIVALVLFLIGMITMLWAFFIAVNRSRVDAIGVGGLYFGAGSTPRLVRLHILGATVIQLVVSIATASARPFTASAFGTLVPILGIGIMGLWTARHGEFEPTDDPPPAPPEGDNAEEA